MCSPVSSSPSARRSARSRSKARRGRCSAAAGVRIRNGILIVRDFHLPGRSPVYACDGMAATSHPLATSAAVDALKAGGTAADAAVAAVAVLCVVEPHMTTIGGDCFCLIARPGQKVWGYNGAGRSAAATQFDKLGLRGKG